MMGSYCSVVGRRRGLPYTGGFNINTPIQPQAKERIKNLDEAIKIMNSIAQYKLLQIAKLPQLISLLTTIRPKIKNSTRKKFRCICIY